MDTDPRQPQPIEYPPPTLTGEGEDRAKWAWNINPNDEYLETVGVKS